METTNVPESIANAKPGPAPATISPARTWPGNPGSAAREADQGIGLLQPTRRHGFGHETGGGGGEEGVTRAEECEENEQVPDLRLPRQQKHGYESLRQGAQGIGGQHHALARQPVGKDTTEQQEDDP